MRHLILFHHTLSILQAAYCTWSLGSSAPATRRQSVGALEALEVFVRYYESLRHGMLLKLQDSGSTKKSSAMLRHCKQNATTALGGT